MTGSDLVAAVIVERSKAGERSDMFTADTADLGQTHQYGNRGSQSDAIDAGHQLEPLDQIPVLADRCCQLLELEPLEPLATGDLIASAARNPWVAAALTAVLQSGQACGQ